MNRFAVLLGSLPLTFSDFVVVATPLDLSTRSQPQPEGVLAASVATNSRRISIKAVETALAIVSLAFVALTYQLLINVSRRLSSTSKLPMRCIKHNMAAVLALTWPDNSNSTLSVVEEEETSTDAIKLLYCGEMKIDDSSHRIARGIEQCKASPTQRLHTPHLWLTNGSSATSSMVSLVIWEWVIIWMVLFMLVVSLFHNGIIIGPINPDAYLRLAIVLTYVVAYAAHAVFVWRSCTTWFTSVTAGASWSLLNRARFGVIDTATYDDRLEKSAEHGPLPFREVSQASTNFKQETFEATLAHESNPINSPHSEDVTSPISNNAGIVGYTAPNVRENAVQNIEKMKRNEVTTTVDAASEALQRVIANGMLIAVVTIASGYLIWSSRDAEQNAQLGSLGLLGSLSAGGAAMFTSAIQLQSANTSFEQLLLMKEILINGQAEEYSTRRTPLRQPISFMQNSAAVRRVRMRDFVKFKNARDVICCLLFGPGWFLLPTKDDQLNKSKDAEFELLLSVRGHQVLFTTSCTDAHATGEGEKNVNAVNVCFLAEDEHEV